MSLPRLLLTPLTWPYAWALGLRHALYDRGLLRSVRPGLPAIAIGNLALGGTGKTPMLELLLRTLEDVSPLATLSRGYGRQGTGFHEVLAGDTAERAGDEPLQVKRKFPGVRVFVGADRVGGIRNIQRAMPDARAVLLDDALQHRRLDAGLNILLTTWQRPWSDDALFPAGRLRDLPMRAKAAQVVVVTKCPHPPSPEEQREWRGRLGLRDGQELFFSGIEHEELMVGGCWSIGRSTGLDKTPPTTDHQRRTTNEQPPTTNHEPATTNLLLFTGIADPSPLMEHLRGRYPRVEHVAFADHHAYTTADLRRLARLFDTFAPGPKLLVTTEKDAARLPSVLAESPLAGRPLATIGMRAVILNEPGRFAALVHGYVGAHSEDR